VGLRDVTRNLVISAGHPVMFGIENKEVGHVARKGETKHSHVILVWKPLFKGLFGRPKRVWEDKLWSILRRYL
jgi:hypothetical protein